MRAAQITVSPTSSSRWRVDVRAAGAATAHEVSAPEDYLESLGVSGIPPARVIEESFRFLLEREPNTSILREFSLPVIERYFPEYPAEIARRLRE